MRLLLPTFVLFVVTQGVTVAMAIRLAVKDYGASISVELRTPTLPSLASRCFALLLVHTYLRLSKEDQLCQLVGPRRMCIVYDRPAAERDSHRHA